MFVLAGARHKSSLVSNGQCLISQIIGRTLTTPKPQTVVVVGSFDITGTFEGSMLDATVGFMVVGLNDGFEVSRVGNAVEGLKLGDNVTGGFVGGRLLGMRQVAGVASSLAWEPQVHEIIPPGGCDL